MIDNNERRDSIDEGHLEDIAPETSLMKMEQMIHTNHEQSGLKFIISITSFSVLFHNLPVFTLFFCFVKIVIEYSSIR